MHTPVPQPPPLRDLLRLAAVWLLLLIVASTLLWGCARKKQLEAKAETTASQASTTEANQAQTGSAQSVARIDYIEHLQVRPSTTTTVRIPRSISQPLSHTEDGITTTITPRPDGTKDVHTHVPADTQKTLLPRATLSGSVQGSQAGKIRDSSTQETGAKTSSVSRPEPRKRLHWGWKLGLGALALGVIWYVVYGLMTGGWFNPIAWLIRLFT